MKLACGQDMPSIPTEWHFKMPGYGISKLNAHHNGSDVNSKMMQYSISRQLKQSVAMHQAPSIEQGYFILTMMPSLYCELDCPHCYLSLEQRKNPAVLDSGMLRKILTDIDAFYHDRKIDTKTIQAYHYGGEPTSMGINAFIEILDVIDSIFSSEKGYGVHHTILTSLVGVDLDIWHQVFRNRCAGRLQTSYDGSMRGRGYLKLWEAQMRRAKKLGLKLSTISVLNTRMVNDGPEHAIDYLCELGVDEASFLPFMLNQQNSGKKYDVLAPSMSEWSHFMIELSRVWITRRANGGSVPEIGQMRFILAQDEMRSPVSNIAGQTLFLMPDGSWSLPDYRNGWEEYMLGFGSGLNGDFSSILSSPKRRDYMRRQIARNGNAECLECPHSNKCVMEFWKVNRDGDECFGGRQYVEWVLDNRDRILSLDQGVDRDVLIY